MALLSTAFLPILLTLTICSIARALFQPFTLGTFNGTVVSDGVFTFCENPYKVDDQIVKRVLFRSRDQVYPHTLAENVAVIDINGHRVIVDTGVSHTPFLIPGTEDGAKLLMSMKEAGIPPESIDAVLLTHAHSDHAFGLVAPDGTAAFPNAVVYISKIDHKFWANPTFDTELTDQQALLGTSQLYLNALSKYPNKLRLLNDGDSPTPGVVIRLAPGHSPGHSIYEFKKGKARLTVIGDLYHLRELQVSNVDIGFLFDTNSTEAAQSRRKMLRVLERRRDLVLSFHDNFPGLGYIRRKRKYGFDWVFASLNDLQPKNIESCPL